MTSLDGAGAPAPTPSANRRCALPPHGLGVASGVPQSAATSGQHQSISGWIEWANGCPL